MCQSTEINLHPSTSVLCIPPMALTDREREVRSVRTSIRNPVRRVDVGATGGRARDRHRLACKWVSVVCCKTVVDQVLRSSDRVAQNELRRGFRVECRIGREADAFAWTDRSKSVCLHPERNAGQSNPHRYHSLQSRR
jgi:hypothetical protein